MFHVIECYETSSITDGFIDMLAMHDLFCRRLMSGFWLEQHEVMLVKIDCQISCLKQYLLTLLLRYSQFTGDHA